jgi:hypothetical protein
MALSPLRTASRNIHFKKSSRRKPGEAINTTCHTERKREDSNSSESALSFQRNTASEERRRRKRPLNRL